jgi:nitrogen regulatory protein PII
MKRVDETVMTFNLDRIKEQLRALGVNNMVLSDARRAGSVTDFLPRIHLSIVVPDHMAGQVGEVLRGGA